MHGNESTPCTSEIFDFRKLESFILASLSDNMTMIGNAKRFARIPWLQQQSFCFDGRESIELSLIITPHGLCFGFNLDDSAVDKST